MITEVLYERGNDGTATICALLDSTGLTRTSRVAQQLGGLMLEKFWSLLQLPFLTPASVPVACVLGAVVLVAWLVRVLRRRTPRRSGRFYAIWATVGTVFVVGGVALVELAPQLRDPADTTLFGGPEIYLIFIGMFTIPNGVVAVGVLAVLAAIDVVFRARRRSIAR